MMAILMMYDDNDGDGNHNDDVYDCSDENNYDIINNNDNKYLFHQ
jgi:hypothetical protein